jgi:hypothetical protein
MPENLYDYYFHFNIYTDEWNAVKRTDAVEYLNGTLDKNSVLKNTNINNLIKYISKQSK